jgi:phospholipid transport system substrate-binding protein
MINRLSKTIKKYALVIIFIANSHLAAADPLQNVQTYINDLANQVIDVVKNKSTSKQFKTDKIFGLLQANFNLNWMSKFVIAQNYRQLSADQKTTYQTTYGLYFLYSYLPNLMKYTDESFKIIKVLESSPGNYTVQTQILRTNGQPPISIDYQVKPKQNNPEQYQIVDVVVEGVSAIMSQRSEFSSIIQQSGMNGFLSQIQAKTQMLKNKTQNSNNSD